MKQLWQNLSEKYDALTLRERAIIALLFVVVLVMLWSEVLMLGLDRERQVTTQNINSMRTQVDSLNKQAEVIIQAATIDPNKAESIKLGQLQDKLKQLDKALKEKLHGLISPTDMARALEAVLVQQTNLRLLKIESVSAEPLFKPQQDQTTQQQQDAETKVGIYKHGLQIEFLGSYLDTLEYLKALEALPWDFYWDGLKLKVEKYPKSKVTIKVHTISLDEDWIGV